MAEFENDPKKIAEAVRTTLASTPGNPEFAERWKWDKATKQKDGTTLIPADVPNKAAMVVHSTVGSFNATCGYEGRFGSIGGCYDPSAKSIHIRSVELARKRNPGFDYDVPWNVRFEGDVVHEAGHSDSGLKEYRARRLTTAYFDSLGYGKGFRAENPDKSIFLVGGSYRPFRFGQAFREFLQDQQHGRLSSEMFSEYVFPGRLLRGILSTHISTLAERVAGRAENAPEVKAAVEEAVDMRKALDVPLESKWMREFIRGLTEAGPLPLELSPREKRFFESLVRAATPPKLPPSR